MPLSVCLLVCVCVFQYALLCTLAFVCVCFPNVVFGCSLRLCMCTICVHLSMVLKDSASVCVCVSHGDELGECRIYVSG